MPPARRPAGEPPPRPPLPPRRHCLRLGLAWAAGALFGAAAAGCRAPRYRAGRRDIPDADVLPESPRTFPLLDVSGEPYAIGLAQGKRFRREHRLYLQRRRDWLDDLLRFADNEGCSAFERMVGAARRYTPEAVEEVRGLADGAGIPFRHLLVLHCRSELQAVRRRPDTPAGCSTLVAVGPGRVRVAHNEDGDRDQADLMTLLRVRPPSGVRFLALAYPAQIAGNAPAINDRGIVQVTNYIGTLAWRPGIPRLFLDRLGLEARTLDEAVRRAIHPDRAYACHHVFAESRYGRPRAVGLEVTPTRSQEVPIRGTYLHTNHLRFDALQDEPEVEEYVARSSLPREQVLSAALADAGDPADLQGEDLVRMLSSHQERPFSPCRHPAGEVRGITVACALFDVGARSLALWAGPPCRGRRSDYVAPDPVDVA